MEHLTRSKEEPERRSFLDKIISLLYLMQAILRDQDGQTERAEEDLQKAVHMARAFDDDPVYTLENVIFTEHFPKTAYFYDDSGPTAAEGLRRTLEEVGDHVSASFREKFTAAMSR